MTLPPAIVATATALPTVGNTRGRVQHLARCPRGVPAATTPTGRLRPPARPVCGQRARRWLLTHPADPRPLCTRCSSWATSRHPRLLDQWTWAPPATVAAAVLTVTDPHELHQLVMAICSREELLHHVVVDPDHGNRRRLTAFVPEARRRCATPNFRRNS